MGNNKTARLDTANFTFITFSFSKTMTVHWAARPYNSPDVATRNILYMDVACVNMVAFYLDVRGYLGSAAPKSSCCRCQHSGYNVKKTDASRQTLPPRKLTGSTAG